MKATVVIQTDGSAYHGPKHGEIESGLLHLINTTKRLEEEKQEEQQDRINTRVGVVINDSSATARASAMYISTPYMYPSLAKPIGQAKIKNK